jgi:hypothetical protein
MIFSLASVLSLKGSSETSGFRRAIAQPFSALSHRAPRCAQSVHFNAMENRLGEEWREQSSVASVNSRATLTMPLWTNSSCEQRSVNVMLMNSPETTSGCCYALKYQRKTAVRDFELHLDHSLPLLGWD